ncbi:MAG: hypothetical protein KAR20_21825 [Candidatus Heimdallarchaeota archaeon]|nr:hypothetical protein [Candidatus Heimdallarchaeota archaeon]
MFSFTKSQEVFEIGSIHIGGQPGQYPTVLFGGLFFKGKPDRNRAKDQFESMQKISDHTGVPGVADVFIRKQEYIEEIISFIRTCIPEPFPFSIDIQDPQIKVDVLHQLHDHGLLQRTIYNSLHVGVTQEEIEALESFTPEMMIIVAFNPKDRSPDGKIEVLETSAHIIDKGLLDLSQSIGVKKMLIDTAALAPGENSGGAIAALPVIKEEYGLPSGCAIHNVVEKSTWLYELTEAKPVVDVASNINVPLFGGDYVLFGPMKHAPLVFPTIAWQDILISEYVESYFGVEPVDHHPRRILMR